LARGLSELPIKSQRRFIRILFCYNKLLFISRNCEPKRGKWLSFMGAALSPDGRCGEARLAAAEFYIGEETPV
jgi:hypothetical protein